MEGIGDQIAFRHRECAPRRRHHAGASLVPDGEGEQISEQLVSEKVRYRFVVHGSGLHGEKAVAFADQHDPPGRCLTDDPGIEALPHHPIDCLGQVADVLVDQVRLKLCLGSHHLSSCVVVRTVMRTGWSVWL